MDIEQEIINIDEESAQMYAEGANSFIFVDWKAWELACLDEERMIPPKEFKSYPPQKKMSYLKGYKVPGHA